MSRFLRRPRDDDDDDDDNEDDNEGESEEEEEGEDSGDEGGEGDGDDGDGDGDSSVDENDSSDVLGPEVFFFLFLFFARLRRLLLGLDRTLVTSCGAPRSIFGVWIHFRGFARGVTYA
jgi:hypothetical protein